MCFSTKKNIVFDGVRATDDKGVFCYEAHKVQYVMMVCLEPNVLLHKKEHCI